MEIATAPPSQPTIGLCVTCCNRLWQLKETLGANLEQLGPHHSISLVDYGSTDGLADWVWSNFRAHIGQRLVFFEVTNEVKWNVSRAKNLAHRLSPASYLLNLDADNFICEPDLALLEPVALEGVACFQFSGKWTDGSFGRIGLPRELFLRMGGYDEGLLPMGSQDIDLLRRLRRMKVPLRELGPPTRLAVQNTYEDKVAQFRKDKDGKDKLDGQPLFELVMKINDQMCQVKLRVEGPLRPGGFSSFQGRLNGEPVTLDGFGGLHPLKEDPARASPA